MPPVSPPSLVFNTLPRTFSIDKNMRVAIIVPYRARAEHLARFFAHFDALSHIWKNYEIFVIEQISPDKFNLGLLRNAGFFIANRTQAFDRYIFHDVDSYPSPTLFRQYAAFPRTNIHYASPYLGYKYKYARFMGGVIGFTAEDFQRINGYPNTFFGWGGEDDALCSRVLETKVEVYRPAIGKYELADHAPPTAAEKNMLKREHIAADRDNWRNNGIAQLADPALNIKYRRLNAPTDMIPAPAPETLLAHFRRERDKRKVHFYGIDWPSFGSNNIKSGGAKKNQIKPILHSRTCPDPHKYRAAYIARLPENEGRYIADIRAFMAQHSVLSRQRIKPPTKARIALLFIVQDKMPLIDIWSTWLSANDDSSHFEVFIHAKYPVALRKNLGTHPFASRIVNSQDSPIGAKWGSIELTQTMHFLLYVALTAPTKKNTTIFSHLVFLSESCVPIVPPHIIIERSVSLGIRSQFRIERMHECKDTKYSLPRQFMALAREIPEECVLKSDQWVMLSYTHTCALLKFCDEISAIVPIWYLIASVSKASDEMFVPTTLSLALGKDIDANIDAEVDARRITYTEHLVGAPHPRTFTDFPHDIVQNARDEGACFLRKIVAPVGAIATEQLLRDWYNAVIYTVM